MKKVIIKGVHFQLIIILTAFLYANVFSKTDNCQNIPKDNSLAVSAYLKVLESGDRREITEYIKDNYDSSFIKRMPIEYHVNFQMAFYYISNGLGYDLKKILDADKNEIKALLVNRFTEAWIELRIPLSSDNNRKINNSIQYNVISAPDSKRVIKLKDEEITYRMRRCMQLILKDDEFSGVIMLAKNGEPLFEEAYGLANKSDRIPNRPDTKFNIASVGKMFTAVAVAQLAEQGKLSFNDTLSKYISPEWLKPEISKKIEIRHLLTHTSGLGDYFRQLYDQCDKYLFGDLDDYKMLTENQSLGFEPGTKWSYSNTGMLLLGVVIEKVTGMKYFDYLDKYIFKPAGMKNTGDWAKNSPVPDRALGYYKEYSKGQSAWKDNSITRVLKGNPSGGCYSTTRDLLNFSTALRENKLLSPEYTSLVLSPKPEINSAFYGYGFFINKTDDGLIARHSGDGTGISCQFSVYLDDGYTVVILSNYNRPAADIVGSIVEQLIASR
jgi:CubicO group peptidase (beta-lactamase class C family)